MVALADLEEEEAGGTVEAAVTLEAAVVVCEVDGIKEEDEGYEGQKIAVE